MYSLHIELMRAVSSSKSSSSCRIATVENTNLEEFPFAISTQAAEMERLKAQPRSQVALRKGDWTF